MRSCAIVVVVNGCNIRLLSDSSLAHPWYAWRQKKAQTSSARAYHTPPRATATTRNANTHTRSPVRHCALTRCTRGGHRTLSPEWDTRLAQTVHTSEHTVPWHAQYGHAHMVLHTQELVRRGGRVGDEFLRSAASAAARPHTPSAHSSRAPGRPIRVVVRMRRTNAAGRR